MGVVENCDITLKEGGVDHLAKVYKSMISEIAKHTFNTGQNKYAAQFTQFTQSPEEVAYYLQCNNLAEERYLVAETLAPSAI